MFQRPAREFERTVLTHLQSAYNLARWLTGSDADAEDVVQEASVRAFEHFSNYRGGDARSWLLTIVRNSAFTLLRRRRSQGQSISLDDLFDVAKDEISPEDAAITTENLERLRVAIEQLPAEFREVVVLRDMEDLTYQEIGDVIGVPIGTVMSRLSRARRRLRTSLSEPAVVTE